MINKKEIKMILIISLLILFCLYFISGADNTADNANLKITDILTYGIESEILNLLKDLGKNPRADLYPKLLIRYKEALSTETKVVFLDYFSLCNNVPQNILDVIYMDASSDFIDKRLETSLIFCLGGIGKKREGDLLLKKLDQDDAYIKSMVADSISKMKLPELGPELLKRLEDSEKIENKYLDPEIKSKLLLFFGENQTKEAVGYLQKIVSDKANNKYMIMYAMVSLLKIGDVSSIRLISNNLTHDDVKVKEYAAYAISLFKNAEALPYLRKMLLDNNENIRVFGCQGLALNSDYESIQVILYKFKNDPSVKVKNEALVTLVNLGQKGIDKVKETLKGQKLSEGILAYLTDSIVKKPNDLNIEYLMSLYNTGEKKEKDVIAKYSSSGTSNKLDPLVMLFLNSTDYIHRINGIKLAYQIENTTAWNKINDLATNDKINMVKDNAKKYFEMKK